MSKTRRKKDGRYAHRHSPGYIAANWVASLLSLGLFYLCGHAVVSNFAAFRSCASNNTNLAVNSCGKTNLNFGDIVMIILFLLTGILTVSLFTAAWRATRKVDS